MQQTDLPAIRVRAVRHAPKGRGNGTSHIVKGCSFINGLPFSRDAAPGAQFPLPLGESVRVRGRMQQNDLSTMRARAMRHSLTAAERVLWFAPRDRRFIGLKFRRQVPPGPWIADFFCAQHNPILEADGDSHDGPRDLIRDRWLQDNGFRTLRLSNRDLLGNLPGCLDWIAGEIAR